MLVYDEVSPGKGLLRVADRVMDLSPDISVFLDQRGPWFHGVLGGEDAIEFPVVDSDCGAGLLCFFRRIGDDQNNSVAQKFYPLIRQNGLIRI